MQNFDGGKFWRFWRFPDRPKFYPSNCLKTLQHLQVYGERQWPSIKIFSVRYLKSKYLSKFPPVKILRYTVVADPSPEIYQGGWLAKLGLFMTCRKYYHNSRIKVKVGHNVQTTWSYKGSGICLWNNKICASEIESESSFDQKLWNCKPHDGWLATPSTPWISPWSFDSAPPTPMLQVVVKLMASLFRLFCRLMAHKKQHWSYSIW